MHNNHGAKGFTFQGLEFVGLYFPHIISNSTKYDVERGSFNQAPGTGSAKRQLVNLVALLKVFGISRISRPSTTPL